MGQLCDTQLSGDRIKCPSATADHKYMEGDKEGGTSGQLEQLPLPAVLRSISHRGRTTTRCTLHSLKKCFRELNTPLGRHYQRDKGGFDPHLERDPKLQPHLRAARVCLPHVAPPGPNKFHPFWARIFPISFKENICLSFFK